MGMQPYGPFLNLTNASTCLRLYDCSAEYFTNFVHREIGYFHWKIYEFLKGIEKSHLYYINERCRKILTYFEFKSHSECSLLE